MPVTWKSAVPGVVLAVDAAGWPHGGGPMPDRDPQWPRRRQLRRDEGPRTCGLEFDFLFDVAHRVLGAPFGISPASSGVRVSSTTLEARFGPWRVSTPISNIEKVEPTGPYGLARTGGPARWSFADHGITFASNGRAGLCICFRHPVPGLEPTGRMRHPGLTVTVADISGLAAAIRRQSGSVSDVVMTG